MCAARVKLRDIDSAIDIDVQRQTAVTVYLKSKQLLLFVFAWRSVCHYSMAEENPVGQRQTTVTAFLNS